MGKVSGLKSDLPQKVMRRPVGGMRGSQRTLACAVGGRAWGAWGAWERLLQKERKPNIPVPTVEREAERSVSGCWRFRIFVENSYFCSSI